jgi:hypothetical protein
VSTLQVIVKRILAFEVANANGQSKNKTSHMLQIDRHFSTFLVSDMIIEKFQ